MACADCWRPRGRYDRLGILVLSHLLDRRTAATQPQTDVDLVQLLRTTGFAGYLPVFTGFITIVTQIWIFVAFVVAIRQALDYSSTFRAIAVCLIGWLVYVGLILMFTP